MITLPYVQLMDKAAREIDKFKINHESSPKVVIINPDALPQSIEELGLIDIFGLEIITSEAIDKHQVKVY